MPISLRQSQVAPLHTKSNVRTAAGPRTRGEQDSHKKTQSNSGSWAHCKPLAPKGWVSHFETSHFFTCLLPVKPKMMGMESSVQLSGKQASHGVKLDPWHMLVGEEHSLNANAEGTCPRLQYKLKSKAPFLPPCPPTPLPSPGTNPMKTVQEPNFYSSKNYINTEFNT